MNNQFQISVKSAITIIALMILGFLSLTYLIGVIIGAVTVLKDNINGNTEALSHLVEYLQLSSYLIPASVMFISILILKKLNKINFKENISLSIDYKFLLIIIILSVTFLIINSEIENLISILFGRYSSLYQVFINLANLNIVFSFITIAFFPSIIEELIFRGIIQRGLVNKYNVKKGIIVSSILFAVIHLNPNQIVPIFLLSLIIGYVYYRTNNLIYPILIHFFNNLFVWILLRFDFIEIEGLNTTIESIEHIDVSILIPAIIIFLLMSFLGMSVLKNKYY